MLSGFELYPRLVPLTICPKVVFLYFRTVAKCKAEQTSSERRRSVRRGTGQNPKSRYEHY